tara:strand:+ start:12285 stop:12506 length:222 start_codon:yes stop_codon:yes gene_type:complete
MDIILPESALNQLILILLNDNKKLSKTNTDTKNEYIKLKYAFENLQKENDKNKAVIKQLQYNIDEIEETNDPN